jgi:hypothetical protein
MVSRFSLDKHIKKNEPPIPSWAQSRPLMKKLYFTMVARIKEIEHFIDDSEPDLVGKLSVKQRKVVASEITDAHGVDRSNLSEGRAPGCPEFIAKENRKLAKRWQNRLGTLKLGPKLSMDDMANLVKQKDEELEELRQVNLHEYFDAAVKAEILNSQRDLANKLRELKNLYTAEQEKSSNLTKKNRELIRELTKSPSRPN